MIDVHAHIWRASMISNIEGIAWLQIIIGIFNLFVMFEVLVAILPIEY